MSVLVYDISRNVYSRLSAKYTEPNSLKLFHTSTATGSSTYGAKFTGTIFKLLLNSNVAIVTNGALLVAENEQSTFSWTSSGYWSNTIALKILYSTISGYTGSSLGNITWYYPGRGYSQNAITLVTSMANASRYLTSIKIAIIPGNKIAFVGVNASYAANDLYNPGPVLVNKNASIGDGDYYKCTINLGSSSVNADLLRTTPQTGLGALSSYITSQGLEEPTEISEEDFLANNPDLIEEDDSSIYSPGGSTSNPHNPYPSGSSPYTVDPLDSGVETDSPDTDGTWELPFDTVSLDHARVDSSQAGIYRLVGLTQQQLQLMADYMFSDASPSEAWENLMKLIYGNVVDTIIGIQEFPMDVSDSVGTDIFCFIGRTPSTGMFVGKNLTSEYRSLDFGTIEVPRYSGTFYDFEPYTTLTLYIPYIGYIDMKPTEVVGSTLYINGWVHLSTGEVTVNVRSSRTGVLGSYSGNIGRSLPISSADSTRLYAAIIETAAGIGGYASFGASASAMGGIEHADPHNMNVARGQYAQAVRAYGSAKKGVRGAQANMLEKQAAYEQAKEEFSSAKTAERQEVQAAERAEREFNEAGLEAYSNAIDAVTSGFEVVRGTHMTPGAGRTSPQVCFLRIEVPHQNVSKNQKLLGYPCNSAEVLNSDKLHGYTELRMIDLQIPGISLTELQELESILKGGFYLP